MEFLSGQEFALSSVRFQLIAEAEIINEEGYMAKFVKQTINSWTVRYSKGEGFPIFLTIMLTRDNIVSVEKEILLSKFPENSFDKRVCIFQVDKNMQIIEKKWFNLTD